MATTAPPVQPPTTLAQRYESELRRLILDPIHRDITDRVLKAGDSYEKIRQAIRRARPRIPVSTLNKLANQYYSALRAYHKKRFTASMRRFLGSRVDFMGDKALRPVMQQRYQENVDLIKTIPARHLGPLEQDIEKLAATKPFDQSALTRVLAHRYNSSGYNLRRITRDQTNKAIGDLTEARHRQAGITHYRWQTSEDERVRPTHAANNGKIFAWDDPPDTTGHPGDDILCRCTAVPVITRHLSIPRAQLRAGAAEAAPYPTHKRVARALGKATSAGLLRLAGFWRRGRLPMRDVGMGLINLEKSNVVEPVDFLTGLVGVQARREAISARQLVAGALNLREDQSFAGQLIPGLFGLERGARTITREQLISTLAKRRDILARPFVPRGDVTRTDLWLNLLGYRRTGKSPKARKTKAEAAARALGKHGRAPVTPKEMLLSLVHLDLQDMTHKDLILGLFGARRIVADLDSGDPAKVRGARARLKAVRKAKLQGAVGLRAATRSLVSDAMVASMDQKTRRQPITRMEWLVGMMLLKPQLPREWALALRRVQRATERETDRKVQLAQQKAYWEQVEEEVAKEDLVVNLEQRRRQQASVEKAISDLRGQQIDDAFYHLDSTARSAAHEAARARVVEDLRRDVQEKKGVTFRAQITFLERNFGELTDDQKGVLEGRLAPDVLQPGPAGEQATAFGMSPEDFLILRETMGGDQDAIEAFIARRTRGGGVGGAIRIDPDATERAREAARSAYTEQAESEALLRSVSGSRFGIPGPTPIPELAEDLDIQRVLDRRSLLGDEQKEDLANVYDDFRAWRELREPTNEVAEALGEANVDVLSRYETAAARMTAVKRGLADREARAREQGMDVTPEELSAMRAVEADPEAADDFMRAKLENPNHNDDNLVPPGVPEENREAYIAHVHEIAETDPEEAVQALEDYKEALTKRDALQEQYRRAQSMEQDTVALRNLLNPYIKEAEQATTDDAYRNAVDNLLGVWQGAKPGRRELPSEVKANQVAAERLREEREAKAHATIGKTSAYEETRKPTAAEAAEMQTVPSAGDFSHALRGVRLEAGGDPAEVRRLLKEKGTGPAQPNLAEHVLLGERLKTPRRGQTEGVSWWPPRTRQELMNDPEYTAWRGLFEAEQKEWIEKTLDPEKQAGQRLKIMAGNDPRLVAADKRARDYRDAVTRGDIPQPIEIIREYARTTRHFGQEETPVGERAIDNLVQRYERLGFSGLRQNPEVREYLGLERDKWEVTGSTPTGEYARDLEQARRSQPAGLSKPDAVVDWNIENLTFGRPLNTIDLPRPEPVGLDRKRILPMHEQPEEYTLALDKIREGRRRLDNAASNLRREYAETEAEWLTKAGGERLTSAQRAELGDKLRELDTRQREIQKGYTEHDRVLNASRRDDWNLEVPDLNPRTQFLPAEDRSQIIERQVKGMEFQRATQLPSFTKKLNEEYGLEIERRVGVLRQTADPVKPLPPWDWKEELREAADRERIAEPEMERVLRDLREKGVEPPKVLGYEEMMKEYRLIAEGETEVANQAKERMLRYNHEQQEFRNKLAAESSRRLAERQAGNVIRETGELPTGFTPLESAVTRHAATADPLDMEFYRKAVALSRKPEDELTMDETAHLLTARERIAQGEYKRVAKSRGLSPRIVAREGEGFLTPGTIGTGEGDDLSLPGGFTVIQEHRILERTHPYSKASPMEEELRAPVMVGNPEDAGGPYAAGVTEGRAYQSTVPKQTWDPETARWTTDPDPTWMDVNQRMLYEQQRRRNLDARARSVADMDKQIADTDDAIAVAAERAKMLNDPNALPFPAALPGTGRSSFADAQEAANQELLGLRLQKQMLERKREEALGAQGYGRYGPLVRSPEERERRRQEQGEQKR